jgi:hypothetical protein
VRCPLSFDASIVMEIMQIERCCAEIEIHESAGILEKQSGFARVGYFWSAASCCPF